MNISGKFFTRRNRLMALLACGLLLAGCDAWNNAFQVNDPNDVGEQIMQKHYMDGDIPAQQYQNEVKVFNPQAQLPGTTAANTSDGLDAAFPATNGTLTTTQLKPGSP
jgi:hypothetical protein